MQIRVFYIYRFIIVKDDAIVEQIGVYEFLASQYTQLLDEDDDFDVTLLSNPYLILFIFYQATSSKTFGYKTLEMTTTMKKININRRRRKNRRTCISRF